MKVRLPLLAAAALSILSLAPAQATTTLYKFCADSTDGTTYTANTNAAVVSGWTIYDPGAVAEVKVNPYSYPIKFKTATYLISPATTGGAYIAELVIGARVSATTALLKVTPFINGAWGTAETASLSDKGILEEKRFVYPTSNMVSKVKIEFQGTTGYVYYTSETTLIPFAPPANLRTFGDIGENSFAVTWNDVTGAQGYSVKLLDANDAEVFSTNVLASTTNASFSGLTSLSTYKVFVAALGNHTTTDDSVAATLTVKTAASSAPAPTLVVANTSWAAGVAGTSAVSATLAGDVACTVESATMSDGSTATVANGVFSWTPPVSNLASTVTATFHVSHGTDGWDIPQVLSVAATPAPSVPAIEFSNITRRAFDVTWSSSAGGPVASYKIRAWTGRETPDDATGGASESFTDYVTSGTVPPGWTFDHAEAYTGSTYAAYPVGFKSVSGSAISPDYGARLSSVSFRLRAGTGSFIVSAAPSGSDNWTVVTNYTSEAGTFTTELKTVALDASAGYSKIKLEFVRTSGSAAFGTFTVSGTDWPAADFLEGWGGAKTDVGLAISQTISNPVAGQTNYVEVTAVGPTGLSTSTIASVAVPARPSVISVQ